MGCVKGRTSGRAKKHDMAGDPSLLRTVESGLGGHEAGVLGVDEGVENTSIPLLKWMRMGMFVCMTFSDFWSDENDYIGEKGDGKRVSS